MTAAEARKKATEISTNEINSQFAIIIGMIKEAVNKGEFETYVHNVSIKPEVRVKLATNGYSVGSPESDRNETYTKITW